MALSTSAPPPSIQDAEPADTDTAARVKLAVGRASEPKDTVVAAAWTTRQDSSPLDTRYVAR